jgi:pimeloyl-ACP methyl ester carboxylesterase
MNRHVPEHGHIEYEDVGNGRPIVFLHAFPLSHHMWRPQIDALAENCRVIAPSMRGSGGSASWTKTPSIGAWPTTYERYSTNCTSPSP